MLRRSQKATAPLKGDEIMGSHEREGHGIVSVPRYRKLTWLLALGAILVAGLSAASAAQADTVVLAGSSWLNGQGVDVLSGGDGSNSYVNGVFAGTKWQCVELVNRLYLTRGWTSKTWYGNGGGSNSIYNNAPSNLIKELNGAISSLRPGDVVSLDGYTYGHAAIVNSVSGSSVQLVNQNAKAVYSNASFTNGTLTMQGWAGYTVHGVIHAPTGGTGDLYFIKTKNTGSGHVEVHSATASSNYQSAGQHSVTYLSPGDANNGWFQMVGSDLYFIKTKNTGSGYVEVHSATASSSYQSGQHSVTSFSPGDANNGWFQMDDVDGDGRPDLVFIKTKNTGSGHVEVHWRTAASNFQSGFDGTTYFSPGDANNGWFQMVGSDLYFIKTKNTGSGHVEVHDSTAASNYQSGIHNTSYLSPGDADNGWFQIGNKN